MSDFFTRQAERALGVAHAIEPLLASRFAESAFAEGEPGFQEVHAEVEGGRETSRAFHHAAPHAEPPRTDARSSHADASSAAAAPALSPVSPSAPVLRRLVDTGDGSGVAANALANTVDFGRAAGESVIRAGNTPRGMESTDRDRAAGSRDQESAELHQNFADVRQPSAVLDQGSAEFDDVMANVHPGRADRGQESSERDGLPVDNARGAQYPAGASEDRVRASVDGGPASTDRPHSDALLMEAATGREVRDAAPARSAADREYALHTDSAAGAEPSHSRSGFSPGGGLDRQAREPDRASEDGRRDVGGSVAAASGGGLLFPADRDPEMPARRTDGSRALEGSSIQPVSRGVEAVGSSATDVVGSGARALLHGRPESAEEQELASRARGETQTRSGEQVTAIGGTDSGDAAGSSSSDRPVPQTTDPEPSSAALLMPAEHGAEPARQRAGARGAETDFAPGPADERNAMASSAVESGPVPRSGSVETVGPERPSSGRRSGSTSTGLERSGAGTRSASAAAGLERSGSGKRSASAGAGLERSGAGTRSASTAAGPEQSGAGTRSASTAGLEWSGSGTRSGSAAAGLERADAGTRSGSRAAGLERAGSGTRSGSIAADAGPRRSGSSAELALAAEAGAAVASAQAGRARRGTTVADDSGLLLPPTRRARQAEGAAARGGKMGASRDHAGDGSSSTQRSALNAAPGRKPEAVAGRTPVPPAPGRQQSPARPVARNPEPVVTVSIGRIEVRAAPAAAPEPVVQPAAPGWRAPVLSLDDYLKKGGR